MTARYCDLTDYVCIEARGADAASFLHAQLSQSVESLPLDRAPLAGWHDARGRVRALVRVHRLTDRWLLVTARDGAEELASKLRLFVLRSAVALTVDADTRVGALIGATPEWLAERGLPTDAQPNQTVSREELRFTRLAADYWQVVGPRAVLERFARSLPGTAGEEAVAAEIALGLPLVTAALRERFVAQMLNLDRLGAIAFDKGCYPGQEVIARVHNLGGVKRHARRYRAAATPPPGSAVTAHGTAVGEVLRSAATAAGCELLAVVDDAAAAAPLEVAGLALRESPLPFASLGREG